MMAVQSLNQDKVLRQEFDIFQGYVIITDPSEKVLYVNKPTEKILGASSNEIKGKNLGDLPVESSCKNQYVAPVLNLLDEVEYFIDIQPKCSNQDEEDIFDDEFNKIIPPVSVDVGTKIEFISKWLVPNNEQEEAKAIMYNVMENEFCGFLEHLFLSSNEHNVVEDHRYTKAAQFDHKAFEALYEKYEKKIYNYFLYRVSGDSELAEDLTQETFIHALDAIDNFEFRGYTYLSYLLIIAHNLLVNYYRCHHTISLDNVSPIALAKENHIQEMTDCKIMWDKVGELSKIDKIVLKMKYQEGLSIIEIAKHLDKSPNAIKLSLSRARKHLQDKILG